MHRPVYPQSAQTSGAVESVQSLSTSESPRVTRLLPSGHDHLAMTSILEHSATALREHLGEGETVIAATRSLLEGGTMRMATTTGVGVGLGLGAGVAAADRMAPTDAIEARFGNGAVIAVTGSRIMLMDVTAVGAKPKSLVLHIERDALASVDAGEKRVMLVKMMTIALTLAGNDHRVLRFEIPKTSRRNAEAVVAALNA